MMMEEIRIANDGTWYFNGLKMFRMEIVGLLSSHLRLKDNQYYICWLNQEVPVVVEDVPFIINGVFDDGQGLKARLSDERVVDLPAGEIFWQNDVPYFTLFNESVCNAKFTRAAFWQISQYLKEENGRQWIEYP